MVGGGGAGEGWREAGHPASQVTNSLVCNKGGERTPLVLGQGNSPFPMLSCHTPPRWQGEMDSSHIHPLIYPPPKCGTLHRGVIEGQRIYESNTDSPITLPGNPSFQSQGRNEIIVK